MLAGCGGQSEHFAPGTWELESWMEADGRSGRTPTQTDTVKLTPERAARDMRHVMFGEFYHGVKGGEVAFKDGTIKGHLEQQAIAPFPAHQQTLSGTYSPESFEIRIAMPKFVGVQTYQVVTGRLAKPY